MPTDLYASPIDVQSVDECYFYHVMDIPGIGVVGEEWDLRNRVDRPSGLSWSTCARDRTC